MEDFKWLSYSALLDGAFCLKCVLFGGESSHNASKFSCLFKKPLRSWAVAMRRFIDHETKSDIHKTAILRSTQFRACMEHKTSSIDFQCNEAIAKQVEINIEKLIPIVEAVILCGRQNIPLRGYRDDSSFSDDDFNNTGNLQALLKYVVTCGNNSLFEDHIKHAVKSATYCSKTTQNEIIKICKRLIIEELAAEIKNAKFFSILADEAADVSNCEQLSLVIRFVVRSALIREAFLGFFPCFKGLSGKAIAKQIISAVSKLRLDMNRCKGQGYDGAGNMA